MIHQMGRSRDRTQVGAGRGCVMQTGCFSGGMGCSETSGSCTHCDCTKCRRTVLVACRKISPQFKKKKDTRPQSTLARFVKCCRVLRGPGNNPERDRGGGGLRKERQKAGSGGRRPLTTERAATSGFHARARVCRLTGECPRPPSTSCDAQHSHSTPTLFPASQEGSCRPGELWPTPRIARTCQLAPLCRGREPRLRKRLPEDARFERTNNWTSPLRCRKVTHPSHT